MIFLQPWLLWLLPLAALPIVIHLLNRMRFRTVEWAASRFLYAKSRASTRHARVRQWLLLACRVLALLALIVAVARPLAGGWAGWMFSPAPDAILILMDRSASMETRDAATGETRRERALQQLAQTAAAYGSRTRFVLIENVARQPEEVAQPALLPRLPDTGATVTAADLPGMFDAASEWLAQNRGSAAEIWIASDLQRTNWQPDSPRWRAIAERIAALPQRVRVRLLAMDGASPPNTSVTLVSAVRNRSANGSLALTFDLRRSASAPATLPVGIWMDGVRTHFDLAVTGASTRVHQSMPIAADRDSGYGYIDLPPDGNERDNNAYFVYAPPPPEHVAVIGPDDASRASLAAAADPFPSDASISCDAMDHATENMDWDKYAAVIWESPLPAAPAASRLEALAKAGGSVIFFPTGTPDPSSFLGGGWGQRVDATAGNPLPVQHWDQHDGPLADSESGTPLALPQLQILRAQPPLSAGEIRAAIGDNEALLTERIVGRGRVYFCATLPRGDWSSLGDGDVLVPMLQRIIAQGAARFSAASYMDAGDPVLLQDPAGWISLDGTAQRDVRTQAGVYRNGARLAAVNRPALEDDPETLVPGEARELFNPLNATLWEDRGAATAALQGEIWRSVLFAMLIFLVGESALSLPPRAPTLQPRISPRPVGAAL
jgi:hypothetical protein